MAFTTTPPYPQVLNSQITEVLAAGANTPVTVFTAGANGSILSDVIVSTDDTAAQTIQILIKDGAVSYVYGQMILPIGSGTVNGSPPVNLMTTLPICQDEYGNKVLSLKASQIVQFNVLSATAGKKFHIFAQGRDF